MKKVAVSIMATLVLATMSFGAQKESSTFTGEIMDSECAKVGSHEMMMKKEGAKNATQCTLACVKILRRRFLEFVENGLRHSRGDSFDARP
jgi:hypothetical protein